MKQSEMIEQQITETQRKLLLTRVKKNEQVRRVENIRKRANVFVHRLVNNKLKDYKVSADDIKIESEVPGTYWRNDGIHLDMEVTQSGNKYQEVMDVEIKFRPDSIEYEIKDSYETGDERTVQFVRSVLSDFVTKAKWVMNLDRRSKRFYRAKNMKSVLERMVRKLESHVETLELNLQEALLAENLVVGNFIRNNESGNVQAIVKVTPKTILLEPMEGEESRRHKHTIIRDLLHGVRLGRRWSPKTHFSLLTKQELTEILLEKELA